MRQSTLKQRLHYYFDNSLAGGTPSLIAWLAVITAVMVLLATTVLVIMKWAPADGEADPVALTETAEAITPEPAGGFSFLEGTWQSLMRSMDAGTVAGDPAEDSGEGWAYRLWGLAVTFGGIFILSSLIGILTSGLESKLEELRKGKSFVCEEKHTLILGWSSRIFRIVSELAIANGNATRPRVVILADKDKIEMEDEIRTRVELIGRTKVVCRSGSPIDLDDLEIVNPHATKTILILSPEGYSDPDAQVIKMILAITNNPRRRPEPYHIVAELRSPKNIAVAKMIGGDEVEIILPSELISRITVQTSRQTGLSVVYKELLDFGGDEIYFKNEPGLVGRTYAEALSLYGDTSMIGICRAGVTRLNPPMGTKVVAGDLIVSIAADDDRIHLQGQSAIDESAITTAPATVPTPERNLILGWSHKGEVIVEEMDKYVAPGSALTVVSELPETEAFLSEVAPRLNNLAITFQSGDTSNRQFLDSLALTGYEHIILLCYSDTMEIQDADSKTLMTLLHLRDIESKSGEAYSVVSEMLDVKNRVLAEVAKADDFIVSDELAGLLLTQVAENKALARVFEDLFDAEGSEIYLKPAPDYVETGKAVNFYTIVESAKRRHETAIGYRLLAEAGDADKAYGVRVNPEKSSKVIFSAGDKVIVLAEN
jgi:ion channel POLLUX/CASTOR